MKKHRCRDCACVEQERISSIRADIELYRRGRINLACERPRGWRSDCDSLWVEIQLLNYQLACLCRGSG